MSTGGGSSGARWFLVERSPRAMVGQETVESGENIGLSIGFRMGF